MANWNESLRNTVLFDVLQDRPPGSVQSGFTCFWSTQQGQCAAEWIQSFHLGQADKWPGGCVVGTREHSSVKSTEL